MNKQVGYVPGGGMLSPDGKIFYFNIPKNASTYVTNLLKYNNWSHWNIIQQPIDVDNCLVILRDPVERWLSGFGTYAALHLLGYGYGSDHFVQDYNDLAERLIFDQIVFDDHTDFQLNYVQQIINCNPVYFRLNQNLKSRIDSYLGYDLNSYADIERNQSESNYDTGQISKFMKQRVADDPALKTKLVIAHYNDYKFLSNINFYNDPR